MNTAHVSGAASRQPHQAERTESVRILALVGIVLGLAGLFGLLGRALFESKGWWALGNAEGPLGYWPIATSVAGVALSALLLAGAWAAFHLKRKAVPMLRAYAVISLLVGAAAMFLYGRQLPDRTSWQFPWGGFGTMFEMLYWPAAMAFAIAVLICFSRPRMRAAFGGER